MGPGPGKGAGLGCCLAQLEGTGQTTHVYRAQCQRTFFPGRREAVVRAEREITVIPCDFGASASSHNRLILLAHTALKMGHFTYKCSCLVLWINSADLATLGPCSCLERRVCDPAMTRFGKVWDDCLP